MAIRSYSEFSQRMAMITSVPCPDCGMALPCGRDEDQEVRYLHYRTACKGKSAPAQKMVIGEFDYTAKTTGQLILLRAQLRCRLLIGQNPKRAHGVNAILHPAYEQIIAAVDKELSRRKGASL